MKSKSQELIDLVSNHSINGATVPGSVKGEFRRLGKNVLKEIAKKLGLQNYEIRFNAGGNAVSGDAILHSDNLYICMAQFFGNDTGFLYRKCKGMKDYSSGRNHWMGWTELQDIDLACLRFKSAMNEAE